VTGPLAAVLVCGGACCAGQSNGGHPVIDALKPLVRRTPHAVLIRTACLHPHDDCPGDHGACAVGLQLCDAHLAPLSPCTPLAGTAATAYRRVEAWFDETASTTTPAPGCEQK